MAIHSVEHIQEREGDYFVGSTRVTLGSAIAAWQHGGERPESITEAFPSIARAEAYSAIAFYLDHRQQLDQLFADQMHDYEQQRAEVEAVDPAFYADLRQRTEALRKSGWLRHDTSAADAPGNETSVKASEEN